VEVHISAGTASWTRCFPSGLDPARGLPLIGLRPGKEHNMTVRLMPPDGRGASDERCLSLVAPELPVGPNAFPQLRTVRNQARRREPGMLLISVHRYPTGRYQHWSRTERDLAFGWGMIVGLDELGEVVWYYQSDGFIEGIDQLRNGNILFHRWDFCSYEIDMFGNVVNRWYAARRPQGHCAGAIPVDIAGMHHQPVEMPNGNLMVFTAEQRSIANYYTSQYDVTAQRKNGHVVGDGVAEVHRRTGEILWHWCCFDHLDPMRVGYGLVDPYWSLRGFPGALDWTHGNGVAYDEKQDAVILSLRNQDALVKVDRATGGITWILGEPTDWGPLSSRLLRPVNLMRWPYHGHNPRLTPQGTIVFFDNGTWGARPPRAPVPPDRNFSRAVEFRVDDERMTVEELWTSHVAADDDSLHAPDMSDAHRLPVTGNMLVVWAHCLSRRANQGYDSFDPTRDFFNIHPNTARLREYSGAGRDDIVFELELSDPTGLMQWGMYGAAVIPTPNQSPADRQLRSPVFEVPRR
jgi:hypothetical protein